MNLHKILLGMPLLVRGKILRKFCLRLFSINLSFPETFLVPMHMFSLPRNTFPTSNRSYLINIIKIVIIILMIKVQMLDQPSSHAASRGTLCSWNIQRMKRLKSQKNIALQSFPQSTFRLKVWTILIHVISLEINFQIFMFQSELFSLWTLHKCLGTLVHSVKMVA